MGPSIAGLLVMAVFFAGLMMLSRTTLLGEVVVSRAMTDAASVSSKRSNTDLTITESVIVMGDECTLNISVKNQGATTIYDFNHMDVIVQFTGGNNISRSLTYDSGKYLAHRMNGLEISHLDQTWSNPGFSTLAKQ